MMRRRESLREIAKKEDREFMQRLSVDTCFRVVAFHALEST